jgi:phage terminase large subunit-like protein
MALGIKTNATYLNVRNGKLYRYSKTKEEGTTTILNKKGEEKYYYIYDYIEGYITKMSTRTENLMGVDKLFLSIQFVDGTETYYINMDVDSKYFENFCSIIPNANLSRPLRMVPTQREVEGKMKSGLLLIQDSQVLKWYYTNDNPQGRPDVDVTYNKKGEIVDYDREARNKFYFDLLQKLNAQLLNPSMLPEVSQVSSTKSAPVVDSFDEDEDSDLPF